MLTRLEIPSSKTKLLLAVLGSAVFVGLGAWFIFGDALRSSRIIIIAVGLVSITFFGVCLIYVLRKLFDPSPGLILDQNGFTDNGSALSAGFIPWSSIDAIEVVNIQGQQLIVIVVSNPENVITNQTNSVKRKLMRLNLRLYGSPICRTSNGLKITFPKMVDEIEKRFKKFHGN